MILAVAVGSIGLLGAMGLLGFVWGNGISGMLLGH